MAYIYSTSLKKLDKTNRGIRRIYGMNRIIAKKLQYMTGKAPRSRIFELTGDDIEKMTNYLRGCHGYGDDGKFQKKQNILRLIEINSYKGIRHFDGLPLRGQRTHTNAKTSRRHKFSRTTKTSKQNLKKNQFQSKKIKNNQKSKKNIKKKK